MSFESYKLDYEILSFLEENKEEWFTVRQLYEHFKGRYSYKSIFSNVKSLYKHGYIFLVNEGSKNTLYVKFRSDKNNNYFSFLKSAFEKLKNFGLKKKNL